MENIFKRSDYTPDSHQKQFLLLKEMEGLQKCSLLMYFKVFQSFQDKLGQGMNYRDESYLENQVMAYFVKIKDFSNESFNNKRKCLSTYFNYLVDRKILSDNPIRTLPIKNRRVEFTPRPCQIEDLQRLINAIDSRILTEFRDNLIILLIVDTGIRPAECFRLLRTDLDTKNKWIKVRAEIAKTSTERYLPISSQLIGDLQQLFIAYPDSDYIFSTKENKPLQTITFQRRMRIYSDRAGVKITPYQLRHFFGTEFAKSEGHNLFYLQNMMGHSNINMTKRYVQVDYEDLKDNHKKFSPLKKLK